MKLYEIHDAIEKILIECVDPDTGEITPEAAVRLDALELQREQVGLYLARAYMGELTEAKACLGYVAPILERAEEHRRRAASHKRRADWLKDYLAKFIGEGVKLKDASVSLYWGSSTSVATKPDATGPDGEPLYTRIDPRFVKTEFSLAKEEAARALHAGIPIAGLELRRKPHLVIK